MGVVSPQTESTANHVICRSVTPLQHRSLLAWRAHGRTTVGSRAVSRFHRVPDVDDLNLGFRLARLVPNS
jgi:hypothetical protein